MCIWGFQKQGLVRDTKGHVAAFVVPKASFDKTKGFNSCAAGATLRASGDGHLLSSGRFFLTPVDPLCLLQDYMTKPNRRGGLVGILFVVHPGKKDLLSEPFL